MLRRHHWPWVLSICIHGWLLWALAHPLRQATPTAVKQPLQVSLWQPQVPVLQHAPSSLPAKPLPKTQPPAPQRSMPIPTQTSTTTTTAITSAVTKPLSTRQSDKTTAAQPTAAQPSVAQPSVAQPSVAQPSAAQPSAAQPSAAQPSAAEPSAVKPAALHASKPTSPLEQAITSQPSLVKQSTMDWQAQISASLQRQQQRELSDAELRAITQHQHNDAVEAPTRRQVTHSGELAANVIAVLDDGRHIVRHGNRCFIAKPGADLLKDVFSIQGVQCEPSKDVVQQLEQILQQRRLHGGSTR